LERDAAGRAVIGLLNARDKLLSVGSASTGRLGNAVSVYSVERYFKEEFG
jgi:hypothetical protein